MPDETCYDSSEGGEPARSTDQEARMNNLSKSQRRGRARKDDAGDAVHRQHGWWLCPAHATRRTLTRWQRLKTRLTKGRRR